MLPVQRFALLAEALILSFKGHSFYVSSGHSAGYAAAALSAPAGAGSVNAQPGTRGAARHAAAATSDTPPPRAASPLPAPPPPPPEHAPLRAFLAYSLYPTLVFERAGYPMEPRRMRWAALAEKVALTGILLATALVLHEEAIVPVLRRAAAGAPPFEAVVALLLPLSALTLVVIVLVFEGVLGGIAEATGFGDREFYQVRVRFRVNCACALYSARPAATRTHVF